MAKDVLCFRQFLQVLDRRQPLWSRFDFCSKQPRQAGVRFYGNRLPHVRVEDLVIVQKQIAKRQYEHKKAAFAHLSSFPDWVNAALPLLVAYWDGVVILLQRLIVIRQFLCQ